MELNSKKDSNNNNKLDFKSMTTEQKAHLYNKYDNFLEALFLSPQLFQKDVIKFMKYREKQLTFYRITAQATGFISVFSIYLIYRLKSLKGFYFRNFCISGLLGSIIGFSLGRFTEYMVNRIYFREQMYKLALHYNITDDEISELQLKIAENMLEKNKQDVKTKGTLDKIKFRI